MKTLIHVYKNGIQIRRKGYLLILGASNHQRGYFNIEFDGVTVVADSFSDEDLKSLKEKLINIFGRSPFKKQDCEKAFEGKGSISFYVGNY